MNAAIGIIFKMCIYILIMYQTYTLGKKRKSAIETKKEQS
jgi:hypothetical protein